MHVFLLLAALLGHTSLWVATLNRVHGTAMPRWVTNLITVTCAVGVVGVPLGFVWSYLRADFASLAWQQFSGPVRLYLATCWAAAAVAIIWWVRRRLLHRPPSVLRSRRARSVSLAADPMPAMEQHARHFLTRLPGNQILRLEMTRRAIDVPRLPAALDGLSIVHFSDFHFTGRVGKAYFQEVIRHGNETEPDLVAITGDLIDHADYIDWIPDTLGRLSARYGVYFVLGNHDLRVDIGRLRHTLTESGLIDLGGRFVEVEVRGETVVLAGNELPWLPPAADMARCPPRTADGGPLRIVLSHSPDQLAWARAYDADLLLAGHTHGGQIRFPLIGPILSPSREGVKYASGLFYAPPTIMHVTRGVSGELPLRLNCPPEMALLVLRATSE